MSLQIELKIEHPSKIKEDETFNTVYYVTNLSRTTAVSNAIITVLMTWSNAPNYSVNHPMEISNLQPLKTKDFTFSDKPMAPGLTVYMMPEDAFKDSNGTIIEVLSIEGGVLRKGKVIDKLKVRSNEEITQSRANKIAITGLIIVIILQIVNWILARA
jgi:hypothetical protein